MAGLENNTALTEPSHVFHWRCHCDTFSLLERTTVALSSWNNTTNLVNV